MRSKSFKKGLFGEEIDSKPHLINWNIFSRPKEKGGLGISGIVNKNQALLGKWQMAMEISTVNPPLGHYH